MVSFRGRVDRGGDAPALFLPAFRTLEASFDKNKKKIRSTFENLGQQKRACPELKCVTP
jgi:hypothetical protein